MKAVIISCYLLATIFILSSCSKSDIKKSELRYSDFENHLTIDMSYKEIIKTFGQPDDDIGSGIHIYLYPLVDKTEMWIGYTDKLHYAVNKDDDGNVVNVLYQ